MGRINQKLKEKILESLSSVLPITAIVLALSLTVIPVPIGTLLLFLAGAVLLILGMGLFSLGAEMAMMPMGEALGARLTRTRRIGLVVLVFFLMGVIVTVAEPDLAALQKGIVNLAAHLNNMQKYGVPVVVAINRFPLDTEAELKLVEDKCRELGVNVALSEVWAKGGEGGKALAEEVKSKLEGGATPEEIAEEYEDQLYSSALSRRTTGVNAAAASYGEWLLDSARKAGDITLAENDTGSSVNYYVAVFEERLRDEENSRSVRHILFRAGSGNETPTQEQFDEAEQKAQDILDQWKAGEATEDSFAALASTSSEDTGSKSGGGLIDQITSNSPYMEPFRDWAVDPARQEGDTGLVKTDYGWHVMYYSSTDDPIWRLTVTDGLAQEDYDKLITDSTEGWSVTRGSGLGLIEA